MQRNPTLPNIDMYCGIMDIYDEDVTSFVMKNSRTCNVKDRLGSTIVSDFDIKVV